MYIHTNSIHSCSYNYNTIQYNNTNGSYIAYTHQSAKKPMQDIQTYSYKICINYNYDTYVCSYMYID